VTETPEPGERRPPDHVDAARRLERPPGERYERPPTEAAQTSARSGIAIAVAVAVAGVILMVLLAGQLAVSSGLLVVAVAMGRFVGLGLRTARGALSPARARTLALVIAIGAIVLAQIGIWLYARSEGGVLELADYLGETFGPLVPLEVALAGVIAVLSAD
jgi:hypothetical protein